MPISFLPGSPGSKGFALLLHEVGHALGLKHTHDAFNDRPDFADLGLEMLDKDWGSIMSYRDDYPWNRLAFSPATPMGLDVLALQFLYGANPTTFAGDDRHSIGITLDYRTLWDAAGQDALAFEPPWGSSADGWFVLLYGDLDWDLRSARFGVAMPLAEASSLASPFTAHWLLGDYEAFWGSPRDDAIFGDELDQVLNGGAGNDTLAGGAGDDWLAGEAGADLLVGGLGRDTAAFPGAFTDHQVAYDALEERLEVRGPEGETDRLEEVEYLAFADAMLPVGRFLPGCPPEGLAVLAGEARVGGSLTVEAQGLFDPDGITSLEVRWLRDGELLPEATGIRYPLTAADAGHRFAALLTLEDGLGQITELRTEERLVVPELTAELLDLVALYVAIPGRAPDASGLAFWADARAAGQDLAEIAATMWRSPATRALYPDHLTTSEVVAEIYRNVLDRQPDPEGLAFWSDHWESEGPAATLLAMVGAIRNYAGDLPEALAAKQLFLHKLDLGAWLALEGESNDLAVAEAVFARLGSGAGLADALDYAGRQLALLGIAPAEGEALAA
ncbi:MAG: hypothetical protein KatS3mg124_0115 [Porticoccaceae bacterium]|nr:MAG: hypothetical protein KatS3mg124_0115 [Porticoccaceae bacterium]